MRKLFLILGAIVMLLPWTSAAADPVILLKNECRYCADLTEAVDMANEHAAAILMLAKVIYREARGVPCRDERAAVAWCVLNRVDDPRWPDTIKQVITQKHQFAWNPKTPIDSEIWRDCQALARDVFIKWQMEKMDHSDVGRVLPPEYVYFAGRRGHNWFRVKYRTSSYWDFSWPSPYAEED